MGIDDGERQHGVEVDPPLMETRVRPADRRLVEARGHRLVAEAIVVVAQGPQHRAPHAASLEDGSPPLGLLGLAVGAPRGPLAVRSEEHTSELQSLAYLVCRLLLEKKKPRNKASAY